MVNVVCCVASLLFFDILYYTFILILSIFFCFSSGDIYLSFGISLSCSFLIVSKLLCDKVRETFVILSAIWLTIKSPVASAVFWIAHFEVVLSASVADCLASAMFGYIYHLNFYFHFYKIFCPHLNSVSFFMYYFLINNQSNVYFIFYFQCFRILFCKP